jgi:hypothetical protein
MFVVPRGTVLKSGCLAQVRTGPQLSARWNWDMSGFACARPKLTAPLGIELDHGRIPSAYQGIDESGATAS